MGTTEFIDTPDGVSGVVAIEAPVLRCTARVVKVTPPGTGDEHEPPDGPH